MDYKDIKAEFTSEDIHKYVELSTKNSSKYDKVYTIYIGGKRYVTSSGKGFWKRKNDASSALNNHTKRFAHTIAENKLKEAAEKLGIEAIESLHGNTWRHPFYRTAYEEIINILKKSNMYKIVETNLNTCNE